MYDGKPRGPSHDGDGAGPDGGDGSAANGAGGGGGKNVTRCACMKSSPTAGSFQVAASWVLGPASFDHRGHRQRRAEILDRPTNARSMGKYEADGLVE